MTGKKNREERLSPSIIIITEGLFVLNEVVEPMHQKYVEPTKKYADIIIFNEYNEEIESKAVKKEIKELFSLFS